MSEWSVSLKAILMDLVRIATFDAGPPAPHRGRDSQMGATEPLSPPISDFPAAPPAKAA
ncbi:MAG TPA: hypothetical protein VFR34_05945 [Paracoccaceae bacterium]|nr:hypothetical protein [Paracoccaceae bacterium]